MGHLASHAKTRKFEHLNMVLECVVEKDPSIKREALHVLGIIANDRNIKQIVKELLNYIVEAEDDFIAELTESAIRIIENNSPNRSWQINQSLRVLTLAGKHLKDDSICTFLQLIAATPKLQSASITQIFFVLRENILQNALARVCLWCIGEFGEFIQSGTNFLIFFLIGA
jgi:AP-1 complex subunit gamma-1